MEAILEATAVIYSGNAGDEDHCQYHLVIDHCQTGNHCQDREVCQNGNENADR